MFGETSISIHFPSGSWNHPSSHFAMWMWRMWLSLVKFHLFHHLKHEFINKMVPYISPPCTFIRFRRKSEEKQFFRGWSWYIHVCVCVFIKFHNFSMSRMNISVGIWQSESFIEKYLPSDVSPLENEHSHLKIWCLEMLGRWNSLSIWSLSSGGTCQFSVSCRNSRSCCWLGTSAGLWFQVSTAPWFFYAKKRRSQG